MIILHIIQKLLHPLAILLQNPINIQLDHFYRSLRLLLLLLLLLLLTRVNLDLFIMDVLLDAPLVIIPLVKVVSPSEP